MNLYLWQVREAGASERCHLRFSLTAFRYPVIHAGGQGVIPCSAVRFEAESATLEINLSLLPPGFVLSEGTGGWFKIRWRRDFRYEWQTAGTRRLTEGGLTSHLNGTVGFFSTRAFANYNGLELDEASAWGGTGITEYKQVQQVNEREK